MPCPTPPSQLRIQRFASLVLRDQDGSQGRGEPGLTELGTPPRMSGTGTESSVSGLIGMSFLVGDLFPSDMVKWVKWLRH